MKKKHKEFILFMVGSLFGVLIGLGALFIFFSFMPECSMYHVYTEQCKLETWLYYGVWFIILLIIFLLSYGTILKEKYLEEK